MKALNRPGILTSLAPCTSLPSCLSVSRRVYQGSRLFMPYSWTFGILLPAFQKSVSTTQPLNLTHFSLNLMPAHSINTSKCSKSSHILSSRHAAYLLLFIVLTYLLWSAFRVTLFTGWSGLLESFLSLILLLPVSKDYKLLIHNKHHLLLFYNRWHSPQVIYPCKRLTPIITIFD